MKKSLPYILVAIIIIAIGVMVFGGNVGDSLRHFNKNITLKRKDKIPYGTYVAYNTLRHIFPGATISTDRNEPGYWDSLRTGNENQALVIVTQRFNPDDAEMKKLIRFVEAGNDVFVSTMRLSFAAEKYLKCDSYFPAYRNYIREPDDSLTISVTDVQTKKQHSYTYPGFEEAYWFHGIDTLTTTVLGYNEQGRANFIRLSAGRGKMFVHLAPLAFSNYFILHKQNIGYYERAMSFISPATRTVVWDEYFIQKKTEEEQSQKKNYLSVLLNMKNAAGQRSFRTAMVVALLSLLVFTLLGMRRRQRAIPVMRKPANDSLDFVKTIGRLYHDRGDHHNLARKMAAYFLEHVRSRYKLSTAVLDDTFVKGLSYKTGIDESQLRGIVGFIARLNQVGTVSDYELAGFHRQLEEFYKTA